MLTKEKLLSRPKDLTYKEVSSFLCRLGYELNKSKGTLMTYRKGSKKVRFHIPHRYETFQAYQVTKLIKDLGDDLYATEVL